MSVWTPRPRSTPRHGEANINVHVLCHRDFIRCFLCNCISRTTVMKMPQRTNEMNCETSPSRRRWPPPDHRDPALASSKALVTFWDKYEAVCPCSPLSPPHPDVRVSSDKAAGLPVAEVGWSRAPMGSHPSSKTRGEAAGPGGRKKSFSCFLDAWCPSALQHLNGITALSVPLFKP